MTGSEFKRIRTISGFTAKEFAESIGMSTSYVYGLEQKGKKDITPRREEEFIEFLGRSVYEKSRRIYELEIQQKEKYLREQEERRIREEKERQEEEERERTLRQQQLQEKKIRREEELAEQIKAMEGRVDPDTLTSEFSDAGNRGEDATVSGRDEATTSTNNANL